MYMYCEIRFSKAILGPWGHIKQKRKDSKIQIERIHMTWKKPPTDKPFIQKFVAVGNYTHFFFLKRGNEIYHILICVLRSCNHTHKIYST